MRNSICIALTILLGCLSVTAASVPVEKLTLSFVVQPIGKDRGKVVFSFKPNPQFDFNKIPPVTIEIQAKAGVQWDKTKQLPKDSKPVRGSQYYGRMEPVEFHYSLTSAQSVEVTAKVTYFYCSKKDGFCAREIKNLTIPLKGSGFTASQ